MKLTKAEYRLLDSAINEMKPMTLRDALRDSPCPRPANGQPEDQNVGDCVDKGLCGCQNGESLRTAAASAEPVDRDALLSILSRYQKRGLTIDAAADEIDSYIWSVIDAAQSKISASVYPTHSEPITTEQLDQLQFGRSLHARPTASAEPVAWQRGNILDGRMYWHEIPMPRSDEVTETIAYWRERSDTVRPLYTAHPAPDAEIVAALKAAEGYISVDTDMPAADAVLAIIRAALAKAKGGSAPEPCPACDHVHPRGARCIGVAVGAGGGVVKLKETRGHE